MGLALARPATGRVVSGGILGKVDTLSKFNIAAVSYLKNRDLGFTHIVFALQQGI
jgi:hypothetical protein